VILGERSGHLLEDDRDVVVTCVTGILLKNYRNQILYAVVSDR